MLNEMQESNADARYPRLVHPGDMYRGDCDEGNG